MDERPEQAAASKTGHLLAAALVCGIVPLVTGVAIFLAWISLQWESLVAAEEATILVGALVVAAGFVCLCIHECRCTAGKQNERRALRVLAALILVANIPTAIVMIQHYFALTSRPYIITVYNRGSESVSSITLTLNRASIACPGLAPNEMRTFVLDRSLRYSGAEFRYEATMGDRKLEGIANDYLMPSMGGHTIVVFGDDGVDTATYMDIRETGLIDFGGETLKARGRSPVD